MADALGHYHCNECGASVTLPGVAVIADRWGNYEFIPDESPECDACGSTDLDLIEGETC